MIKKVIQVIPTDEFKVYVYFSDGVIKLYDMNPFLNKGIFTKISNLDVFKSKCTVMNSTLAWDLSGKRDSTDCIDIDPETIYLNSQIVDDPLNDSFIAS
jgi:hypothetical protein